MKEALIIFVRSPELGKVKTRLAAKIGNEKALEFYVRLLHHTRSVASLVDCDRYLFSTGAFDGDSWKGFHMELQSGGDLGNRMSHAFRFVFNKGYTKVVIIGSDCHDLSAVHINDSFSRLDNYNVVIGPSKDGGYYLLGMRKHQPEVFENKNWSTRSVFTDTLRSIDDLNLKCCQLEELADVDEEEDLPENWKKEILNPS